MEGVSVYALSGLSGLFIQCFMRAYEKCSCKLDARKCKTLGTGYARSRENIVVDGEEVEDVNEFCMPECYCRQGGWR